MKHVETIEAKRSTEAKKVTWVGFIVNAILTGFKFFAGIQGNSAAMVADAVRSMSDFFTDIVVLVGFRFTVSVKYSTYIQSSIYDKIHHK